MYERLAISRLTSIHLTQKKKEEEKVDAEKRRKAALAK